MAAPEEYDDSGYKNWLRACLGLKYLKEGLIDFVDREVKQLYTTIITNVCGSRTCNQCTTEIIRKRHQICPNNVCNLIRQEIERHHVFGVPCWQNSDSTRWCTDYWEIGKCFMSPGYDQISTAADTDCSGFINVCINGTFLPPTITGQIVKPQKGAPPPNDIFHKNREARNTLLHSGTMSLSDVEREEFLQDMINLLTSYDLPIDHTRQEAISKLLDLNTDIYIISSNDKYGVLKARLGALETQMVVCQTDLQKLSQKQSTDTCIIKEQIEKVKDQMKKNSDSLALVEDKLGKLQHRSDEGFTEIKNTLEVCRTRNENRWKELSDLLKSLEARVGKEESEQIEIRRDVHETKVWTGKVEDKVTEHEYRIGKVKDEMTDHRDRIGKVEDEVTEHGDRIGKIEDEVTDHGDRIGKVEDEVTAYGDRIGKVEDDATEHGDRIGKIEDEVNEIKAILPANIDKEKEQQIKEIREYLVMKYTEDDELTVPMSPLLDIISVNVDDVYIELTIKDDLVHKKRDQSNEKGRCSVNDGTPRKVKSYHDVLFDDKKNCKNIYVVGKAGVGKTTWSRRFVSTWVRAMENRGTYNVLNENETVLQQYDLVFYISLRHARGDISIMDMIKNQLFPTADDLFPITKSLMNSPDSSSKFIVMLDGLDEWKSHTELSPLNKLPRRDPRCKSINITTTRSWKLEALQLKAEKIDRAIEIQGLRESDVGRLIAHVVSALNDNTGANKKAAQFPRSNSHLKECKTVPLMLTIFVCLWYETGEISKHLTGLYCGLVNLVFQYAERNEKIEQKSLNEMKRKWQKEQFLVPDSLQSHSLLHVQSYLPLLLRLGKLAFNALFADSKEFSLVFDRQSVEEFLHQGELDLSVKIGLLSQTIHPRSVLKQQFNLTFLHKTVQEYLAAIYMACGDRRSECLKRYKTYCANDPAKVMEMENLLLFLSGLNPEVAADVQCYITENMRIDKNKTKIKANEYFKIPELLIRCFREEDTLYACHNTATNIDNIVHVIAIENGSTCIVIRKLVYKLSSGATQAAIDNLDPAVVCHYSPSTEPVTECEKHRTVLHQSGSGNKEAHIERLTEAEFFCYSTSNMAVLEMSGCRVLRKISYKGSTVAIQLPTESLEVVEIERYSPSTESVLDMSGCKVLRKISYNMSTTAIRLPTESLEEVEIEFYRPSTESVLEMSGCRVLRKISYKLSTAAIRLPTESLEEVVILDYRPRPESVLDMSGCRVLRKLSYTWSTVAIRLPTESLEEVEIEYYRPSTESVLDMSGCRVLRKISYKLSTAVIRLPTESLKEVEIDAYTPSTESVLDMSGCRVLRKISYKLSTAVIRLPTESLEEVEIHDYSPRTASELDMSGCKVLRKLSYKLSTVAIRLPTESLEEINILDYSPSTESVLDMSGCRVLKKLSYTRSLAAIRLPTESLEEINICDYRPSTESVLDMSGCKVLRKLSYKGYDAAIRLPTDSLEEVEIHEYDPSTESVLDMSGCRLLKKLHYKGPHKILRLPMADMDDLVIEDCEPELYDSEEEEVSSGEDVSSREDVSSGKDDE